MTAAEKAEVDAMVEKLAKRLAAPIIMLHGKLLGLAGWLAWISWSHMASAVILTVAVIVYGVGFAAKCQGSK